MQRHFAAAILVVRLAQQACGENPASAVIGEGTHVKSPLATQYAPDLGKGVNLAETRTFARCVTYPEVKSRAGETHHVEITKLSPSARWDVLQEINACYSAKSG